MEPEEGRLSRIATSVVVVMLRAIGMHQAAAKLIESLRRRRFQDIIRSAGTRCRAYTRSLGVTRGLLTYVRCNCASRGKDVLIQVRAPALKRPLTIRRTPPDVRVFEQVYVDRLHEVDVPFEPRLIIDAGAHIGCVTVALAAKFPECTILAVEPEADNYTLLCRNTAAHHNVIPIRAAVWYKPAVLSIRNPESASWTFQMKQVSPGESGSAIGLTVAELLKWSGSPEIDILKLDVEGAEREIFAAAESDGWLDHVRQIRVELHDRIVPGCEEAVEKAIARHGNRFSRSTNGEYTILQRVS
jgi:FkbM family methyltransferase